jgi:hypothetical protein
MKRLTTRLLLLVSAAALACSSTGNAPPQSAYDHSVNFGSLKTFDWHENPDEEKAPGGAIVDARFIYEHVQADVTADLTKKGFRNAGGAAADFYVEYHTRMAGILEKDKYGVYSWAPVAARYYKQGTLVIDIRDASKKLIWRGWSTRLLGTSPEGIARDISKAVSEILAKFPPSGGATS